MTTNNSVNTSKTKGIIISDISGSYDTATALIMQPNGKFVVAGYSNNINDANYNNFTLVRYNNNGSLDNSFANNGIATTASGTFNTSLVMQSDNKFVAAASSWNGNGYDFSLVRYNSNGTVDKSFGTNGNVITSFGNYSSNSIGDIIIQTDNKLIAAGSAFNVNTNTYDFSLVRYNSNGSLDNSFANSGIVTTDFKASDDWIHAIAQQTDGKLVATGSSDNNFAVVRYNSNGKLDNTFGTNGKVITNFGYNGVGYHDDSANSLLIQSDNKLVVAGSSYNVISNNDDFVLVRYNNNGSLDTSFGKNGIVTTDFNANRDIANALAVQTDGKYVLVGNTFNSDDSRWNFSLARYNSNGSLDTSFGNKGKVITDLGSNDVIEAMIIQPNGKLVVTGYSGDFPNQDFVIARYNSDGSLDSSFDGINSMNHAPTGKISINDTTPQLNQTLTATNTLVDADGLGSISYTWKSGETVLATGNNYQVTANEVGKTLSVTASYLDNQGTFESVTSNATQVVPAPVVISNHAPTGAVSITGTLFLQGQTLTASNSLVDADGLGAISYTWKSGTNVLATGNRYTLTANDTDKSLTVTASYVDKRSFTESVTSLATPIIGAMITGSANAETLIGTDGNDSINGLSGDDVLNSQKGNDTLRGGDGNDALLAGLGDDVLDGGNGTDWGQYWDSNNGVIVNLNLTTAQNTIAAGIDTLISIENLNGGKFNDNLTGNALDNILNGGGGNDTLKGGDGVDGLLGGLGDDILDGGNGIDWGQYWDSNNGVIVNLNLTTAQNTIAAGIDTLISIENLNGGKFNDTLTGNALNNALNGGGGNDTLNGGQGNDNLTGDTGQDVFIFNSPLTLTGLDKITDFVASDDTIQLENSVFTKLTPTGILNNAYFKIGNIALDNNDYIVYNPNNGALFYDADANGLNDAIRIAYLGINLALTNNNFIII